MNVVRITNAHKYYNRGKSNELHVMDNVSLALPASGMIAVFGKSGCGKTTLLNTVGGLDRIQSGSIELFGQNIKEDTDTLRNRHIGYIFQNYNLSVTDTVYENVAAALRLCGMTNESEIAERVMAALTNVGMNKYRDRTPDTLSGGQQQRVAIARALVKASAIILADEPTGNLDEANTVLVMDILKEISKSQLVLLVTHEADLVDYYCDRVIEIVDGRIVSDRVNEGANGYVRRDKNDIYLGELACRETSAPGVKVAYYGEPTGELTLRVVSVGGKLYLKADGADIKLLDDASEIRLREGVFEKEPKAANHQNSLEGRNWDMSRLTPVEGKHYGRLYHFKNALTSAWRENFSKKHRRGKGLLRVCLFLLAVVMVFMTATIGAGIRSYTDLMEVHNDSLFYIPVIPGRDYTALNEGLDGHGIDYTRLIGYSPIYDIDRLSFNSSQFITGRNAQLNAQARAQDIVHAEGLAVVAGTVELKMPADIVVTTAVADRLIESSSVNYIDEYRDLVGLVSQGVYPLPGGSNRMRIVGIVQSDEMVYFMPSLSLVSYVLDNQFAMPVAPASTFDLTHTLRPGEFAYIDNGTLLGEPTVGSIYRFMGNDLTLAEIITTEEVTADAFVAYMEKTTGRAPAAYRTDEEVDYAVILTEWVPHLPAFVKARIDARPLYQEVTFAEWAISQKESLEQTGILLDVDPAYLCAAYLYHQENGTYPTAELLDAYIPQVQLQLKQMLNNEPLLKEYDQYIYERKNASYQSRIDACYILHDDDYRRLITCIGTTSEELGMFTYDQEFVYEDYHSNHLQIKSSDPAATEAFLRETVGAGNYLTPDDVLDVQMNDIRADVILCVIGVLVILALMCLCVYFIMRSSFMSRVREVGILRAIGVTRRNLIYRFAVETGVLIALTLLLGYLLSAYFIASLSGAALFSEVFFFPLWLGGGLLMIICAVSMFFGILPAIVLLRRTPSEILSKYDM